MNHQKTPKITLEILRAYATASGDHNPIHTDPDIARSMGLPNAIAHGMLTAAWLAEFARKAAIERNPKSGEFKSMRFRFKNMALLGDTLELSGEWKDNVFECQATNASNQTVCTASILFNL